ncbi:MAG: bifunctional glycosyltransferase family 2/GtrA family protein [Lachnospiraceae bacterium]|nr:bifunctional glycosyltransferase family 2/GtrA family protein [Lachnospiraceae bacterium]
MEKIEKVIALIPAYNPDEKMSDLVVELKEKFAHILIVNDGCSSDYDAIFAALAPEAGRAVTEADGILYKDGTTIFTGPDGVTLLKHNVNKGKGHALKTGITYIKNAFPDALGVVTADADGQHKMKDIVNCCDAFLENPKEAIFGCRDFYGDTEIPARSVFGNRVTSRLMKFFCDIKLSDTQTGLRVLPLSRADLFLSTKGERYEYEMNCIFEMKNADLAWKEVPIEVIYLDGNISSHFNPFLDSIRIYKVFLKFCLSSVGSAVVDIGLFALFSFLFGKIMPDPFMLFGKLSVPKAKMVPATSNVLARICSGIFNYSINKMIFKHRGKVRESGPKYLVLFLISMTIATALVTVFTNLCGEKYSILIKILVDCVIFFANYKVEQLWVFKNKKKEEE